MYPHHLLRTGLALALLSPLGTCAHAAGAFLFASATQRNRITHSIGYTGSPNQHLVITVGILPTSSHADAMVIPVQNTIRTWNALEGTMPNLFLGSESDVPGTSFDFESVLLHELGHSLGMAHPNLATESRLDRPLQEYTKSTMGENGVFDLNAGIDGVPGSRTDLRGDDLPLLWFHKATNDPFILGEVVDVTTYSQNLADLPAGDTYAANGALDVSVLLGHPPSEVVLQQGTRAGEAQRSLTPGCVAAIRMALAGFDRIQGTPDDYTVELQYVGFTANADITVGFDNSHTEFAVSLVSAMNTRNDHYVMTSASIYFNTTWNWYFNQQSNSTVPGLPQDLWAIY
jgi:hypothetical protein